MQLLDKLYRGDYDKENVNLVGLYIDSEWKYQKENIDIAQYPKISDHAVVIGNGISSREFDLRLFLPYRETTPWGEVGDWKNERQRKNFYTYGCNAFYRDFRPDFLVATGDTIVEELAKNNYCEGNVVYANLKYLEQYPGKFNIIPQNPEFNAGAIAAYMAAFDGHKKVFLLGFDGIDSTADAYNVYTGTNGYFANGAQLNENFWVRSLSLIMQTYTDTEFIRVCPTASYRQPEEWKYYLNYRQIDFTNFVLEADI